MSEGIGVEKQICREEGLLKRQALYMVSRHKSTPGSSENDILKNLCSTCVFCDKTLA